MPIYKIHNYYVDGGNPMVTGHKVKASSSEIALEIAEKHGIAYPFHRAARKRRVQEEYSLELAKKTSGKIWYENNEGELSSV